MPMTWTTLTASKTTEGSIRNWVNHSTVPADTIVNEAEALILQRFRVLGMISLLEDELAVDASTIDISALRYLSPKAFFFYGDRRQQVVYRLFEMFEISRQYDDSTPPVLTDGTPTDYTHNRQTIFLNLKADAIHYYRHWYYAKPAPLSGSNLTNLLTDDYPHIMRAACLYGAYNFRKDSARSQEELAKLVGYIDQAMIDSDMAFETAEFNPYWNQEGSGNDFF